MKKIINKIYFKIRSNYFNSSLGIKVPYILEKSQGKEGSLIVVFSAFPRKGMAATYNYLRTLRGIEGNKLFILDSFGYQKRGAYYLTENGDFKLEKAVEELIRSTAEKLSVKKIICVGTSKGGYAALYFGMALHAQAIICGAPQYYLGNYLSDVPLKKPILQSMMGNMNEESIELLNKLLPNRINKANATKIYIHYSSKEHTYVEHIKYLLISLEVNNYEIYEDEQFYEKHQDVSLYFPTFLTQTLDKILKESSL